MGGNWRHGVAGITAAILVLISACVLLAALPYNALGRFARALEPLGILGDLLGIALLALGLAVAPGLVWYWLARQILRLLGERD